MGLHRALCLLTPAARLERSCSSKGRHTPGFLPRQARLRLYRSLTYALRDAVQRQHILRGRRRNVSSRFRLADSRSLHAIGHRFLLSLRP